MDDSTSEGALQWADWIAVGVTLGISAGIGVYYRFSGGKQRTAEEYFAADRSCSITMLAVAMMVAFLSAISLLGTSGENYSNGAIFNVLYIGFIASMPVVAYFYLPVFYELKTLSVFEYLERRFGPTARLVASFAYFIQYISFTGVVIYAPALALEATTGLSGTMSILLIGLICTFYSTIGGIKAVIVTDILQGTLMFISIFCIIGVVASELEGGLFGVMSAAGKGGRLNYDKFEYDPTIRHSWLSLTVGGFFWFLSIYATGQVMVQRLLTAKSLGDARKALFLNIPLTLSLTSLVSFSGLALYAYYKDCDPVIAGKIKSYDMIMPYFAKERMTQIPGLTGLFVSGIFSAGLSTVSASLNSLAAMALSDYLQPLCRRCGNELDDTKSAIYGKFLASLIGLTSLGIAFLATQLGTLVQATAAIHGSLGGPILGLFTLGLFFESANETGAVIGTIVAVLSTVYTAFTPKPVLTFLPMSIDNCLNGTMITTVPTVVDNSSSYSYVDRLSYLWYTPLGWNTAVTIGSIASFIVAKCSKTPPPLITDHRLFTPIIAWRIRRRMKREAGSQVFVLDNKSFDRGIIAE